ncbi:MULTISPECIES: helix-turn-helix transcriptional regulator [Nocardia]|uniref:helix-turn-helix transcriptional regulator n=1 Tax=Nocardia TaxID=1817 RepID=UPI0007A38583|nr:MULTISPECIES: WYL domain-containing protein [Nocardia]
MGIVHLLRSREWVSAAALAQRFEVAQRTIYRDIEELTAAGIPIESVPGPDGGYRLASDQPLASLTLDADEALKLYVVSMLDQPRTTESNTGIDGLTNAYSREALRRLAQRIYFDTADWYWRDEGSGHLPVLRQALLTGTAVKLSTRVKGTTEPVISIVKPYGIVWKSGEWFLVAAPIDETVTRYRLNLVDQLGPTDLRFAYPELFNLQDWWAAEMEAYGKGDVLVQLRVAPNARDELSRLTLKTSSKVTSTPDGGLIIQLYVDRWEWLIPLVTSYGADVLVETPTPLRHAITAHLTRALDAYAKEAFSEANGSQRSTSDYRNDDSRLRSTRGRASIGDNT